MPTPTSASDKPEPDTGRYEVTKDPLDWGKFKTPTLRDISKTGPYMHDGSLKTLEEVVDFYDKGGIPSKNLDEKIKKLNLTAEQKKGFGVPEGPRRRPHQLRCSHFISPVDSRAPSKQAHSAGCARWFPKKSGFAYCCVVRDQKRCCARLKK
jgi:hypothetical protein